MRRLTAVSLIGAAVLVVSLVRADSLPYRPVAEEWAGVAPSVRQIDRQAIIQEKQAARATGDPVAIARANAPLATEAFTRAATVMHRWLERRDHETSLFPNSLDEAGHVWVYGDTGSDLFPHLAIATQLLAPDRYSYILDALKNERQRTRGVPESIDLTTDREIEMPKDEAIFGAAEYMKDGLLPIIEQLGPDPWLGRLREISDVLIQESATPTPHQGPVLADSTEVNGDVLQAWSRLYWATREPRYYEASERIARTYLEDVLPRTTHLPPNQWNFLEGEPIGRRRFRLSDHGNEILSGLIEWHIAESMLQRPGAAEHRIAIRQLLDRLLATGRNEDGMWLRVIEIPSGKVEQPGVTDSWGYVFQAFLAQAQLERLGPRGDPSVAERYEEAVHRALRSLPNYRDYPWEAGVMDGAADALESAIYLLEVTDAPETINWIDDQMDTLFAFQQDDGSVLERDLDGNFIRSTLLYALRLTKGARLETWSPTVHLGATRDGGCLYLHVASESEWSGKLLLDTPRHRLHFGLPFDYPRLNKWPEWFVVESDARYTVSSGGSERSARGASLTDGLDLVVSSDQPQDIQVCPAG